MISVNTCAVSAITASLRFSDSARSFKLVLVLQPGIQPLQMRLVPEDVGLLFRLRPAPTPGAGPTSALPICFRIERRLPRMRPLRASSRANGSVVSKTAGNLALVPRQNDALRQRLADQDQPLRREALQARSGRRAESGPPSRGQFDDCDFLVAPHELRLSCGGPGREGTPPPPAHSARSGPPRHSGTVSATPFSLTRKRKRRRGKDIAALEARRVRGARDKKARAVVRVPTERRFRSLAHGSSTAEPR